MRINLPLTLTWLRIALIPIFAVVFFLPFEWNNLACTVIFALAGITDWFDGYLARRLDQMTPFGAFLDPVADKLMVATAIVLLVSAHPSLWMALPAAVIIGREITVSALREWMAEMGERAAVKVSWVGKVKTTVQMLALGFLIYEEPLLGLPILSIGYVLFYAAAILTLWSMYHYLSAAWPVLENQD